MKKVMKNSIKIILFTIVACSIAIPQIIYLFKHPEKSETQLFLDFFKAYKEFFNSMSKQSTLW